MPEDSKRELPERYAPLVKYVSTNFPEQTIAFDSAFRRIESRRLLAEQKLRKSLHSYWSATDEQLENLSPLDLVHYFEAYAETIFRAAGEICLGQFHDSESYSAFLNAVQEWIVNAILPEPETFKESQADMVALAEDMLRRAERKSLDHPLVRDLAASVIDLKSSIQTPETNKHLRNAIDHARIIGLRESFSAFEARFFLGKETLQSGDWGCILHNSVWDALLTGSISSRGHSAGLDTVGALSDAMNREEAKLIWTIALEQLQGAPMSAWWDMSADAHVTGRGWTVVAEEEPIAAASKSGAATMVRAQTRCKWLDGKLAGKHSYVDLDKTRKISYNTINKYRSGGVIRETTRRGLSDALNALGISCEFPEVPR